MNIGIVSRYFPPELGGAQTHIRELSRRLHDRGYNISGLTTADQRGQLDEQIDILRLKNNNIRKINRFVKKSDIVHIHSGSGILTFYTTILCKFNSTPSIITLHGGGIVDRPEYPIRHRLKHRFTRSISLRHADRIITTGKIFKSLTADYAQEENIVYIPNGVDADLFKPGTVTAEMFPQVSPKANIFISVNMLKRVKGLHYIIDALPFILEEDPDTHYIAIGEGGFKKELRNRAKKNDVINNVHFVGSVEQPNIIRDFLRSADGFVVPSSGESTSIATLEALATKCPVIASPAGGLIDLIGENERGRIANLFEPGSYNRKAPLNLPDKKIRHLASQISWVINNPKKADNLASQGRQYVLENHHWPVIVDQTEKVYKNINN